MKRLRLLLTLHVIIISMAYALCADARLRYGFRFGGEFAAASLKDAGDFALNNRSGFSGGVALEYQMPKNGFAVDLGVLYTRYNTRLRQQDNSLGSFGRNFIEVPLHFKYKFWLKSVHELVAPLVYTGPSVMVRLDHNESRPLSSDRFQAGWDVGIGFDIVNFIQLSGGYRFGLGNAVSSFYGYPDAVMRTNGWNVSATFLFDF